MLLSFLWRAEEQRLVFMLFCESGLVGSKCCLWPEALIKQGAKFSPSFPCQPFSHLWYTIIWTFISMPRRCCAVNMWTHSLHAFVQHPLSQSAMACLWLGPVLYLWQLFRGLQSGFFYLAMQVLVMLTSALWHVQWNKYFYFPKQLQLKIQVFFIQVLTRLGT